MEPGADPCVAGGAAHSLERLLQGQDEPYRPPELECCEDDGRLVLGVLLAAEPAAGVGREDADPREWHAGQAGDDLLEPVRVLDGAPHGHAVAVRRGHARMRLDGEVGDHREGVPVLDHDSCCGGRRVDVTPPDAVLVEHVGAGTRIRRPQGRVLHEGRAGGHGLRHGHDSGQLLVLHAHGLRSRLRLVPCVGHHQRNRLPVVLGLVDGQHRPVLVLRPEPGHGCGQVVRGHHQPDARQGTCRCGVDGDDPGPRTVERHELRVQDIRERDVREVLLRPRHPADTTDARR